MTLRRREYLVEVDASSFGISNGDKIKIVRWESKKKKMNPTFEAPNFIVYVTAFGRDVSGEGDTKKEALKNAVENLPDNIKRHFV